MSRTCHSLLSSAFLSDDLFYVFLSLARLDLASNPGPLSDQQKCDHSGLFEAVLIQDAGQAMLRDVPGVLATIEMPLVES